MGPILYAIYVAPLLDLTDLSNFADDNFILSIHKIKEQAIESIEIKLKIIIKWLTDSGLKVNEQKTELCLFYRRDTPPIEITIGNDILKSKTEMNVLGVIFDSKLTWSSHVSKQIYTVTTQYLLVWLLYNIHISSFLFYVGKLYTIDFY